MEEERLKIPKVIIGGSGKVREKCIYPMEKEQEAPLVGVLCIDVAVLLAERFGTEVASYIVASYVQFLEDAGARVLPVWIGRERSYYESIMSKISGILIPGGAVYLNPEDVARSNLRNDCVLSSKHIYDIAVEKNERGEFFPLWGTCLGFQLLIIHSAIGLSRNSEHRGECRHMDYALPLEFTPESLTSKMCIDLPKELKLIMETQAVAYHYHKYCITREDLNRFKVADKWTALAMNKDRNGLEFISLVEHTEYPFFGCQFHPERVQYELLEGTKDTCPHDEAACRASRHFAEFFVGVCRRATNDGFDTDAETRRHLIFNFPLTNCQPSRWKQCYLFKSDVDYPSADQ